MIMMDEDLTGSLITGFDAVARFKIVAEFNQMKNAPRTMSSLEVSDLLDVRHDNVKRTIETLADKGEIVRPQFEDEQNKDSKGRRRPVKVYYLEKRDCLVVMAQVSSAFTGRCSN